MVWVLRGDRTFAGPEGAAGSPGDAGARGDVGPAGPGGLKGGVVMGLGANFNLAGNVDTIVNSMGTLNNSNTILFTPSADGITVNRTGSYHFIARCQIQVSSLLTIKVITNTGRELGQSFSGYTSSWTLGQTAGSYYLTSGTKVQFQARSSSPTSIYNARFYFALWGTSA